MKVPMHMKMVHTALPRSVMILIMCHVQISKHIIRYTAKVSLRMQVSWKMCFILIPPQGGPPRFLLAMPRSALRRDAQIPPMGGPLCQALAMPCCAMRQDARHMLNFQVMVRGAATPH